MHNASRAYLPPTMYSAVMPGVSPPALPPTSRNSEREASSPAFEAYRESVGGGMAAALSRYSHSLQAESGPTQNSPSPYGNRLQQEGFPYGISGVPSMAPTMASYNYGNELYNYVSNGFPRKSRICSYCSKVFTRSTTRRYHEKRCPLLRAAGSLMKGNTGASLSSASNDGDADGEMNSAVVPSRPPPLIAVTRESSPPPAPIPNSTSIATSISLASLARSHALLPSQYYQMFGSPALTSPMPASLAKDFVVSGSGSAPPSSAQDDVDQNRNSVLPSVKKEADLEMSEKIVGSGTEDGSRDSHVFREKVGSQGEEVSVRQQPLFSPPSTSSRSPSIDEERDSDDGDQVPFKPPLSVHPKMVLPVDPVAKKFLYSHFASLQAMQGRTTGSEPPYLPVPFVPIAPSMVGEDRGSVQACVDLQDVTADKDDASFRYQDDDDQDDDDTDQYSYTNSNLDMQEPEELEEGNKVCCVCKEDVKQEEAAEHEHVHQKYMPHSCRFCKQLFLKPSRRIEHERLHDVEKNIGCVICGARFLTKFALYQHMHRRHQFSEEEVQCRYCQLTVESLFELRAHLHSPSHHISRCELLSLRYLPSPLPQCSESPMEEDASQDLPPASTDSKTSQDSPGDARSDPSLQGPNTSMSDSITEDNASKLNGESDLGSSREKEWCRICQKEFPKSFMRYHEKEHADQKPYECSICKKRFGYKNNMKSHMKLHAGIKPYQCSICYAKFTRGSTLRRHARRHGINDNMWDPFGKKSASTMQDRVREMMLNHASARDAALAAAASKSQSQGSPPLGGTRAMKADPALLASMGKADMVTPGKKYTPPGFSPSNTIPQNPFQRFNMGPTVTQSMFQPYMTPQQYLGYTAGFASALPTPLPQQAPQSDALDFSMPDKQRQRNASSSSTQGTAVSTPQESVFPVGPSSRSSSANSRFYPPVSPSNGSISAQMKHEDRRVLENTSKSHESFRPQYHPRQRASLCETVERLMEGRSNREAAPRPHIEDLSSRENRSGPFVQDLHRREAVSQQFAQDFSMPDATPATKVHDFSSQVTMCCSKQNSAVSDPDSQSWGCAGRNSQDMTISPSKSVSYRESLQKESIGSLLTSGRLFRCKHCDCYFTDYNMYQVHQKVHLPDHPFVCVVCQYDCQDRTSFSNHLLTHLRL